MRHRHQATAIKSAGLAPAMDACCICNLQLLSNEGQYRAPQFRLKPHAKLGWTGWLAVPASSCNCSLNGCLRPHCCGGEVSIPFCGCVPDEADGIRLLLEDLPYIRKVAGQVSQQSHSALDDLLIGTLPVIVDVLHKFKDALHRWSHFFSASHKGAAQMQAVRKPCWAR